MLFNQDIPWNINAWQVTENAYLLLEFEMLKKMLLALWTAICKALLTCSWLSQVKIRHKPIFIIKYEENNNLILSSKNDPLFTSLVWNCMGLVLSQIKCKNFTEKHPKPWNNE